MPTIEADELPPLAGSRTVTVNAMWSMVGRVIPILVGLALVPFLVHDMGPSRWGVFTIAQSLVGMMGVFDFGVGRALTRIVAVGLASGQTRQAATAVMSGLAALVVISVTGSGLCILFLDLWTKSALQVPAGMQSEVKTSLYILCLTVPCVVLSAGLWGVITVFHRLKEINYVNVPIAILTYAGPLVAYHYYKSLVAVMVVLFVLRALIVFAYWRFCVKYMPDLRTAKPSWQELRSIFRLGTWMTISALLFPVMTYLDRFIIASTVSVAATGYYATPNDLIHRSDMLPLAIITSAYPAIAASYVKNPENASKIFRRSVLTVCIALFPVALIIVCFGQIPLRLWLGTDFAAHSSLIFRLLGAGLLLSCVDIVAIGVVDAIGKPKLNTLVSLGELVVYIPVLAILVRTNGIEGAAVACFIRQLLDFVMRFLLISRNLHSAGSATTKGLVTVFVSTLMLVCCFFTSGVTLQSIAIFSSLLVFAVMLWSWSMSEEDRDYFKVRFLRVRQIAAR